MMRYFKFLSIGWKKKLFASCYTLLFVAYLYLEILMEKKLYVHMQGYELTKVKTNKNLLNYRTGYVLISEK